MAPPPEGRCAGAERVTVACDDLSARSEGGSYESFAPARARRLVRRIEFGSTPEDGGWRDIAENEPSCPTSRCIADRRYGEVPTLRAETSAGSCDLNTLERGVDWPMTSGDARCQRKSVYPEIKL